MAHQIDQLLAFIVRQEASDLHLSSGRPPAMRVHGDIMPMTDQPFTAEQVHVLVTEIMSDEQRATYEADREIDLAYQAPPEIGRFRVNAFTTSTGPAAVLRTIPTVVPSLDELKAPPAFARFMTLERGLILVTGPTGSGKSTTLAAMIDFANRTMKKHILTVEDPIEFVHQARQSIVNQREVGPHTRSFARALKSALREDPDIILVGEMRDLETISLALTAAETGHLVLGTLHTTSAPKTIDRIIDVFPAGDKDMVRAMLSESVQAVISQMLLKRLSGGRVATHEIMVGTPAVRNLIRENKIPQIMSMLQTGHRFGMQTMRDSIQRLVNDGVVDGSELDRFKINFGENEAPAKDAGTATAPAVVQPSAGAPGAAPEPRVIEPRRDRPAPQEKKGLFRGRF